MAMTAASNREIAFFIFYLLKIQSTEQTALSIDISINRFFKKGKRETCKLCKILKIMVNCTGKIDKNTGDRMLKGGCGFEEKERLSAPKNISFRRGFHGWKSKENCAMLSLHKARTQGRFCDENIA
ncbi:hypothetical protein [Oscillibacter ruminantium]|uniref:hypothetical protein n=1 Tax=Oscillibacter ruminantium TaxID=1263547 RepID=UPI003322E11A